ncbi:MAG: alanine racemase, partial [bacterium]|nr:alanine racemase [Candidatus Kapabacteria bacterium]
MMRPTHARINRNALRSNIRTIRAQLAPMTSVMAIVKANCYGHGIEHCIPTMRDERIDFFGVATVEEGAELRAFGVDGRVVVLPPPPSGQCEEFVHSDLEAMISDTASAEELSGAAVALGRVVRVHLHVDSGMTRNGVCPDDALELARRIAELPGLHIVGVASHFATS